MTKVLAIRPVTKVEALRLVVAILPGQFGVDGTDKLPAAGVERFKDKFIAIQTQQGRVLGRYCLDNNRSPDFETNGVAGEADELGTPLHVKSTTKTPGKLDSLPKDELIKFVKKQMVLLKQTRTKCQELNLKLEEERAEVKRLKEEESSWLERGIHAEFEKKDEILRKNDELQMAADLGKKMLQKNDELKMQCSQMEVEHENVVKELEDELTRLTAERNKLKSETKILHDKFQKVAQQARDYKTGLERQTADGDKTMDQLQKDNKIMLQKIQQLQVQREQNQSTIEKQDKEKTQLQQTYNAMASKMDAMKAELKKVKEKRRSPTEKTMQDLRLQNQKLQETLTKTNEEHIELLEGIKAAKKQLKTSEQNNKELKAAMEKLTTDAKEGLIVAEQECQTDESSEMIVNQVRRHATSIDNEVIQLQAERNELLCRLKRMEETLGLHFESGEVDEIRARLIQENLIFKDEIEKIHCENDHLKNALDTMHMEFEGTDESKKEFEMEFGAVQKDLDENKFYVKELCDQLDKAKGEKEKVVKAYKTLKVNYEKLKSKVQGISSSQEDLSRLPPKEIKKRLLIVKLEKDELESAMNEAKKEAKEIENKNKELLAEFERMYLENERLQTRVSEFKDQYKNVDETIETLKKQNENIMFEKDELNLSFKSLQEDYNATVQENKELKVSLENMLTEKEILTEKEKSITGRNAHSSNLGNSLEMSKTLAIENFARFTNTEDQCTKPFHITYLQESFEKEVKQLSDEKRSLRSELLSLNETIANLEKQNQKRDAQLVRYADEKMSLKEEWSAFKQSIQDLNSKNNLLKEQKDALQRQINSYSNERIALQGDLSALNETVQNFEREREELSTELNQSTEKVRSLENEVISLQERLQMTESLKDESKTVLRDLGNKHDILTKKLDASNEEKANHEAEIEDIFRAHDELEVKYNDELREKKELLEYVERLHEEQEDLQAQYSALSKEHKDLSDRLSEIQSRQLTDESQQYQQLTDLQQINSSLQEEFDQLKETCDTLNTSFEDKDNEVSEVKVQLGQKEKEFVSLGAQIEELKTILRNKEDELQKVCHEKEIKEEVLINVESELEKAKESLQDKQQEILNLVAELDNVKATNQVDNQELNLLKSQEEASLTKAIQDLENTIEVLRTEKDELANVLEAHNKDIEEQSSEISKLNSICEERIVAAETLEEGYQVLSSKLQEKEEELQNTVAQSNQLEERLIQSDEELKQLKTVLETKDDFTKTTEDKGTLENENDKLRYDLEYSDKTLTEAVDALQSCTENLSSKEKDLENFGLVVQSLNEKIEHKTQEVLDLKDQKKKQDTVIESLESQVDELNGHSKECTELDNQLQEQFESCQRLKLELKCLQEEFEYRQETFEEERKLYEQSENTREQLQKTIEDTSRQALNYKEQLESQNQDIQTLKKELLSANQSLQEKKQEASARGLDEENLVQNLKSLEDTCNAKQNQIVDLQEDISSWRQKFELKEKELQQSLSSVEEDRAAVVEALERTIESKTVEIKDLQVKLEDKKRQNESLQSYMSSVSGKMEGQEQEVSNFAMQIDELKRELNEMTVKHDKLMKEMKGKDEKTTKMKQVTIKARKELENIKQQTKAEKEELMSVIQGMKEDAETLNSKFAQQQDEEHENAKIFEEYQTQIEKLENELISEKNKCAESEQNLVTAAAELSQIREELETRKNEIQALVSERDAVVNTKQVKNMLIFQDLENQIESYKKQVEQINTKLQETVNESKDHQQTLEERTAEISRLSKELLRREKEQEKASKDLIESANQHSMMSLEIAEYERTLESLQSKLDERVQQLQDAQDEIGRQEKRAEDYKMQVDAVDNQRQQTEERSIKLKAMLVKIKKDLAERKKELNVKTYSEAKLKADLEAATQNGEQDKVEISKLMAEVHNLQEQLRTTIEHNKHTVESLDVKLKNARSEYEATKISQDATLAEFESYKTRVHSVLKQQKTKPSAQSPDMDPSERYWNLVVDQHAALRSDNEELEVEHDRLLARHNNIVLDTDQKDAAWKERLEQLKSETAVNSDQQNETIRHLAQQNETISLTFKDKLHTQQEDHKREVEKLLTKQSEIEAQLDTIKREQATSSSPGSRSPPHPLNLTRGKGIEERQSGEVDGMDQNELEVIDAQSQ
ncbi:hypothetical protein QZH41_016698, partial [Actinostola sp. cb2023]